MLWSCWIWVMVITRGQRTMKWLKCIVTCDPIIKYRMLDKACVRMQVVSFFEGLCKGWVPNLTFYTSNIISANTSHKLDHSLKKNGPSLVDHPQEGVKKVATTCTKILTRYETQILNYPFLYFWLLYYIHCFQSLHFHFLMILPLTIKGPLAPKWLVLIRHMLCNFPLHFHSLL